ncbi:putative leucine-rich repeat-containing protein DDB_G0290503 [Bicyclus anynana]|uniref:Leucine-rich repeat-containing protein DDB_G0290503 n=1 Tax=Bicyclus anynana TaxID=110368 RepID=A0A6J1MUW2_BICAN|nr:putative leucine-rich repeat-containing protein DDB_G0290503 [Bicyclus anynana]
MSSLRAASPAHSLDLKSPRRQRSRRTRSVSSAASNTSVRLTAVLQDSFQLSPVPTGRSMLNDGTHIDEPASQSWWKQIDANSRNLSEIMEQRDNEAIVKDTNIAEIFDFEILSQENENISVDMPESSDGESIQSIIIPQHKIFRNHDDQPQKMIKTKLINNKENLVKTQKSYFDQTTTDQEINVIPKKLFNQGKQKTKPVFSTALLSASANKTMSKSPEKSTKEIHGQVRNLFSNKPGAKRKHTFGAFLLNDSEDDIPDIQPKVFRFPKKIENSQILKQHRRSTSHSSVHSSTSNITDVEMDEWEHLPSSTMVEHQFDVGEITEELLVVNRQSQTKRNSKVTDANESPKETSIRNMSIHVEDIPTNKTMNNENLHTSKKIIQAQRSNNSNAKDAINTKVQELQFTNTTSQVLNIAETGSNFVINDNKSFKETSVRNTSKHIQDISTNKTRNDQNILNKSKENIQVHGNISNAKEISVKSKSKLVEDISSNKTLNEESLLNKSKKLIQAQTSRNSNSKVIHTEAKELQLINTTAQSSNQSKNNNKLMINQTKSQSETPVENVSKCVKDGSDKTIVEEIIEMDLDDNENEQTLINECPDDYENFTLVYEDEQLSDVNDKEIRDSQRQDVTEHENVEMNDQIEEENKNKVDNHEKEEYTQENLEENKSKQEYSNPDNFENNEEENENVAVNIDKDGQTNENPNKSPNVSYDTTGRFRKNKRNTKSPEAVLHDKINREEIFSSLRHNKTLVRSKTIIKDLDVQPSFASYRESTGLTDGSINSSAEGSGWDSHRTTRKTLRQTFGKDFTPRKSMRALVMERSAKRQTNPDLESNKSKRQTNFNESTNKTRLQDNLNDITSGTMRRPIANSTEYPDFESYHVQDEEFESDREKEQDEEIQPAKQQGNSEESKSHKEQQQDKYQELAEVYSDRKQGKKNESVREQPEKAVESESKRIQEHDFEKESNKEQEQSDEIESDREQNQENEQLKSDKDHDQSKQHESNIEQGVMEDIETDKEQSKELESDTEQEHNEKLESDKEHEKSQESESDREQEEEEEIITDKEQEKSYEFETDREQDQDEELESDKEQEQSQEYESNREQEEEEIVTDKEQEQSYELESDREQDQDEELDSDKEQEQSQEYESNREQDEEEVVTDNVQEQSFELESDREQDQDEELDSDKEQEKSQEYVSNIELEKSEDIDTDKEQEQSEEESVPDREQESDDESEDALSYREQEASELDQTVEGSNDLSMQLRQKNLEMFDRIKQENAERRRKMQEQVMNSLKMARQYNPFKIPEIPKTNKVVKAIKKPAKSKPKPSPFFSEPLPPEILEDMKYKPPKRFQGKNAAWITKRLYKYLEDKLEPKYDYRARVRAEKLVEKLYHFAKDVRKLPVAPPAAIDDLKREMARLCIVSTHYDFYCFFHDFMPREIRIRVNPDILNKIPAPRSMFADILEDNS